MSRLRVVTLLDTARAAGGAERLATELALRLDPERFESTLCFSRAVGPGDRAALAAAQETAARRGASVLSLERQSVRDLAAWRPFLSLLRSGVDVVHSHMTGSNVWGSVLGRMAGVPVVVAHEHGSPFEGDRTRQLIDRDLIGRFCDAFVTVSRSDRRNMAEIVGVDPAKLIYLPNGIDVPRRAAGRDVRAELGIAPDAPVLAAVGVLRPEKALDVLVRAAARLRERFPGLRVLLVGAGSEQERLEGIVSSLGLGEAVVFTGVRSDVPDILGGVDVAVCCSEREGMPLSVLEYMEAGLPIVCTRVGGLPDLVEDGTHGLLVPPHDPEALGTAVTRLLDDRDWAASLGEAARDRRRSEFTMDAMVARVELLYEDLCRAKRSRGRRYLPLREPAKAVRAAS